MQCDSELTKEAWFIVLSRIEVVLDSTHGLKKIKETKSWTTSRSKIAKSLFLTVGHVLAVLMVQASPTNSGTLESHPGSTPIDFTFMHWKVAEEYFQEQTLCTMKGDEVLHRTCHCLPHVPSSSDYHVESI